MTAALSPPGAAKEPRERDPGHLSGDIQRDLLHRVASQINFPAWLIAQGFHVSPVQQDLTRLAVSNRHSETLYLVQAEGRGAWSYETDAVRADRGTLLDLLRRDGATDAESLARLANCLDHSKRTPEALAYRDALADRSNVLRPAVARHVDAVTRERGAERALEGLGVPPGTYDRWRFGPATGVLQDRCELGHSRYRASDRQIVVLERPIDALAYERAHGKQLATYVYTGDRPSDETKRHLAHLIADAPAGLRVVAAFGRDSRGAALSAELVRLAGRKQVERKAPEFGSRWADQMQIEQRHRDSLARLHRPPDPILEAVGQHMARALDAGVDQAAIRTAVIRRPSRGRAGIDR